ncbi:MAG: hypothetical protein U0R79_10720 [Propionicimonas sp.]
MLQNLWWAAGYNLVSVPLAAGLLAPVGITLPMEVGAILMSLSTVVVALNASGCAGSTCGRSAGARDAGSRSAAAAPVHGPRRPGGRRSRLLWARIIARSICQLMPVPLLSRSRAVSAR